jgi:hypothetical protein
VRGSSHKTRHTGLLERELARSGSLVVLTIVRLITVIKIVIIVITPGPVPQTSE